MFTFALMSAVLCVTSECALERMRRVTIFRSGKVASWYFSAFCVQLTLQIYYLISPVKITIILKEYPPLFYNILCFLLLYKMLIDIYHIEFSENDVAIPFFTHITQIVKSNQCYLM